MNRTVAGKPPNGPSGRRRGCAVRAFCPRQNLGAGAALPPRALKSRRAERAFGPQSPQRLTSCPFFRKGRSKWIFEMWAMMRTRGREPPNRPSGRRRGCAVRAFCPRQNLGAGMALLSRAFQSRRAEAAFGGRSKKKEGHPFGCPSFLAQKEGFEPSLGLTRLLP